ncbi:PLDc N-terminal domain-containing protein [Algibacter aquimarinus]
MIIIFVVLILLFFPIIALISILKNEFKNNDKIMWVLIVLLVPFLGTILYFILGRPKRIKKN